MSYFVFVVIVFIALTVIALFKLRRTGAPKAGFLTPGYPVTPAIFLALLLVMLVLLFGERPKQALAGVAVVSLGFPVYLFIFRNKRLVEKEGQL
jgi:basic amino acid/polyamine antiporter, APA family